MIGHEMGHGFDDQGRRFDANGVLRDWWAPKDAEEYMKRAKLLVEQYNAVRAAARPARQRRADARREHRRPHRRRDRTPRVSAVAERPPAPVIDGLTGDQRYFFGWAQAWRAKAARRCTAPAGADQPPLARHVSRERTAAQRAGVLHHLRGQGRRQDVPGARTNARRSGRPTVRRSKPERRPVECVALAHVASLEPAAKPLLALFADEPWVKLSGTT